MKLYNSVGPNPQVVRSFMAEKGIELPMHTVDVRGGETRREPYISKVNPRGQSPALELEDGSILTEITAICEYLEELHPSPPLIGSTPEERAETRMWTRRMDIAVCEPLATGFRAAEGYERFKDRFRLLPQAADDLKAIAQDNLKWLDANLGDREFLCGNRFTLADIHLYSFLAFGTQVGQPMNPDNTHVMAWYERMAARPSASA
ncbi:MAG: glutathione S-transferase family protein [Burkholderiaceae bacterium]